MRYYEQEDGRIQADLALRIGKLLRHYENLTANIPSKDKFEGTIAFCCLQALLTNCNEVLDELPKLHSFSVGFDQSIPDVPRKWGIDRSFIKKHSYANGSITYRQFIEHMRHAVSHPTTSASEKEVSTGYTAIASDASLITAFRFIHSPLNDRGKPKRLKHSAATQQISALQRQYGNFGIEPKKVDRSDKVILTVDNQAFLPTFIAEVPLPALKAMVLELSNLLAQPTDEKWDGKTLAVLVA